MRVNDYKQLRIWLKGIEIVDKVYSMHLPKDEQFGLNSQMRRAAISIPSNIAEGFARRHSNEYKQFLYIALGSCAELETQLIICHKRGYLTIEEYEQNLKEINYEMRMLTSLIYKVRELKQAGGQATSDKRPAT